MDWPEHQDRLEVLELLDSQVKLVSQDPQELMAFQGQQVLQEHQDQQGLRDL